MLLPAIKVYNDGKWHPVSGDRIDGRQVRTTQVMEQVTGLTGFSITHGVLAACVRTVTKYPAINRFIAGQRIYSRGEDVAVCMTFKKELTAQAPDALVKVYCILRIPQLMYIGNSTKRSMK